jgi:hypothetical protein
MGGIDSIGASLRVAPSKKLKDCLLQGKTVGFWPCISRLGTFSRIVREDPSEPTVTTAKLKKKSVRLDRKQKKTILTLSIDH